VLDLASAHVLALEYLAGGGESGVYNIGAGAGYSNRQVIAAVKRISGVDFEVGEGPRRPGDPTELVADSTKLRSTVGWEPHYSDLDTIVSTAWKWHSSHPHGYADQ
jgi:UDP-glucose 4-epimerase